MRSLVAEIGKLPKVVEFIEPHIDEMVDLRKVHLLLFHTGAGFDDRLQHTDVFGGGIVNVSVSVDKESDVMVDCGVSDVLVRARHVLSRLQERHEILSICQLVFELCLGAPC